MMQYRRGSEGYEVRDTGYSRVRRTFNPSDSDEEEEEEESDDDDDEPIAKIIQRQASSKESVRQPLWIADGDQNSNF